jgi:hypothetical protein
MRVDEQHGRIRNLQANSDGTFVAHPPTDKSRGDRGLGRALSTEQSAHFSLRKKRGHTPHEMLRIAMHKYREVDPHQTLFYDHFVRAPRPRLRASPDVTS